MRRMHNPYRYREEDMRCYFDGKQVGAVQSIDVKYHVLSREYEGTMKLFMKHTTVEEMADMMHESVLEVVSRPPYWNGSKGKTIVSPCRCLVKDIQVEWQYHDEATEATVSFVAERC